MNRASMSPRSRAICGVMPVMRQASGDGSRVHRRAAEEHQGLTDGIQLLIGPPGRRTATAGP